MTKKIIEDDNNDENPVTKINQEYFLGKNDPRLYGVSSKGDNDKLLSIMLFSQHVKEMTNARRGV